MKRAARPLVSSSTRLWTVTTTGRRARRSRPLATASQPALSPCACTTSTPGWARRSVQAARSSLSGLHAGRDRDQDVRRADPVHHALWRTDHHLPAPGRQRGSQRADVPADPAGRWPEQLQHALRHRALRAGPATSGRWREEGRRRRRGAGHPSEDERGERPCSPAAADRAGHRGHGHPGHDREHERCGDAARHVRAPHGGQGTIRDHPEDDGPDAGGHRRMPPPAPPPAPGRPPSAAPTDHGHQAGHGHQRVGQGRASDVALRVAHPGEQEEEAVADQPGRERGDGVGQRAQRALGRPGRTR